MAAENIEQLFCKEYESLKSENKNLANHNQQLKEDINKLTREIEQILISFNINEDFCCRLSADALNNLYRFCAKHGICDNDTLQTMLLVCSEKKGDK